MQRKIYIVLMYGGHEIEISIHSVPTLKGKKVNTFIYIRIRVTQVTQLRSNDS
jgi:hypothetical protein